MKKFLFLYTELAEYFLNCINHLQENFDADITVIHWPVNKEAPFQFKLHPGIHFIPRNELNFNLIANLDPDVIYCSGWMDKGYLKICKKFRHKIPVITGVDNQWNGSFRQWIATVLSPFTVKRWFSHAWVAGESQKRYARHLGFSDNKILDGVYCADVELFRNSFFADHHTKKNKFPHRLIYVGRYYKFKGVLDLWEAFIQFKSQTDNDWELWCFGTGDLLPAEHECIRHFGFIQPKDFPKYLSETGVFVLPSHFEPWGVVVHELAAAGFPLILSDIVGASSAFLDSGKNGFKFPAGDVESLKNLMINISSRSDQELMEMGERSAELSLNNTPAKWSEKIYYI